jgi:hypothetical protein
MESTVYKTPLSQNDNKLLFVWDLHDILPVIVR